MQEVRAGCRLIELTASGHKSDTVTPPVNCQLCLIPRIQLDPLVEFDGKVDTVIGCRDRRKIVPYLIPASKCNRSSVSQDGLPYKLALKDSVSCESVGIKDVAPTPLLKRRKALKQHVVP